MVSNAGAWTAAQNPMLFQVNTRALLTELSERLGRRANIDDVPDAFFERLAERKFTWVYFLSVWQTGKIGQQISQNHPGWKDAFLADVPDLKDEEICGSGFAIADYQLNEQFGDADALGRLRDRINSFGLKLMLDFVPNHTAIDHIWVEAHPDFFLRGNEDALAAAPQNFRRVGAHIFAHGRDPYFDGWPDTLQLNYGNRELCSAMREELRRIATRCDGVRCDMAMLILPDVFKRTWGVHIEPFWNDAIAAVREAHPDFTFMAEVYWDREWDLQQLGFDFTYDKRLYDRLLEGNVRKIREHFLADIGYQQRSARFLENHDEPRVAGTLTLAQHQAAAILTYLSPGMKFFHDGQFEGYRKRVSVHISRRPSERVDKMVEEFYDKLFACLELHVVHTGNWSLLDCVRISDRNDPSDCFIAFQWNGAADESLVAIINYSEGPAQCNVRTSVSQKTPSRVVLTSEPVRASLTALNVGESFIFADFGPWGYVVLR